MGFLDFIFGTKKRQVETYLQNDAVILDVRTQREWDAGHIEKAVHIPLSELNNRVNEVKQLNKPIIVCCASGVRSAKAAKFLNLNNIEATNGGGWVNLKRELSVLKTVKLQAIQQETDCTPRSNPKNLLE